MLLLLDRLEGLLLLTQLLIQEALLRGRRFGRGRVFGLLLEALLLGAGLQAREYP